MSEPSNHVSALEKVKWLSLPVRRTIGNVVASRTNMDKSVGDYDIFASRRRHTRLQGDWSSDVCSSDLLVHGTRTLTYAELAARAGGFVLHLRGLLGGPEARVAVCLERSPDLVAALLGVLAAGRSEERRVGKECRSRWSPDHLKKKR